MDNLQYLRPATLNEAIEMLDKHGKDIRILAGGTDLIIGLRENIITCRYLMDIKTIKELQGITYSPYEGLSIGSAISLNDIIKEESINSHYPILVEAAKTLANSLLRNRATLVGNLCNASPGGDMLTPSIVLGGVLEVASKQEVRRISLSEFFLGVKKTALKENELVTKIIFPNVKGTGKYLRKSRIKGHDLAQVGVAAYLSEEGGLKISIAAAGPTPLIIDGFENIKKDDIKTRKQDIIKKVLGDIKPISDQRASKEYRSAMVEYLTGQVLDELLSHSPK